MLGATYLHSNIQTDCLLQKITIPDTLECYDVNCVNQHHVTELNSMYRTIIDALKVASLPLVKERRSHPNSRPGWNEYAADLHKEARDAFLIWRDNGKPRQGPLLELKKKANARFKYALRHIKRNENSLRRDALARKLQNNSVKDFWKEVKLLDNSNTPLPTNIEGVVGCDRIAELWKEHYEELLNCVYSDCSKIELDAQSSDNIVVRDDEVSEAIMKLDKHKSCGGDEIFAEHLKYASPRIAYLLARCFSGFLTHGTLPEDMISVILVPVIKDKTGKINSKDNYRPIALASVLSKVFECVLLNRLEIYLLTTDNQYGFKRKHGTDMCIYALKEAILKYQSLNTNMFLCFLDASKAFDRINHRKLFEKLIHRNTPGYLIRILIFWYTNQSMIVRWGDAVSEPFKVSNGVRQGGILSPYLFNVYMDDLSERLNKCMTGCVIGEIILNHLMYADDLVILSPYSAGLQQLLLICSEFGVENDIKYNAAKSNVMIVRTKEYRDSVFPGFVLNDIALPVANEVKYLGHYISENLKDDRDINRQCRNIYARGNTLLRKFAMCTADVKAKLFQTFCTPLYTAHLWWNYRLYSLRKLTVAYNDIMRLLLCLPRRHSASQMFVNINVPTCAAVIRNLIFKFIVRLEKSENSIIQELVSIERSDTKLTSAIWRHWHKTLYIHFDSG